MVTSCGSKEFIEHVATECHHAGEVANIVLIEGVSPMVGFFLRQMVFYSSRKILFSRSLSDVSRNAPRRSSSLPERRRTSSAMTQIRDIHN